MTIDEARRDVIYWQNGGDSFNCRLLEIVGKADVYNRERLRNAFPELIQAWKEWFNGTMPGLKGK